MSLSEMLEWERQQAIGEAQARRLEMERRFHVEGCCPWGCDGSGWEELPDGLEPDDLDIFHKGGWLTPCECNLGSTHRWGRRYVWVRRYPPGYVLSPSKGYVLSHVEGACPELRGEPRPELVEGPVEPPAEGACPEPAEGSKGYVHPTGGAHDA